MKTLFLAAFATAAVAAGAASAQSGAIAVGGQIGTPGVGATVQYAVSPTVVLRGSYDALQYDHDFSSDDVNYGGSLDWSQAGAFVDLHPWSNAFFVSGGAYFGGREVELRGTPNRPVQIGNSVFTAAEAGTISGRVDFGDVAPFAGLGFDNTFTGSGPIGFRAVLGAAVGESPSVSLARTAGVALPAAVQTRLDAELRNEERELANDAEDFRVYPVLQVGVTYRF